MYGAWRYKPLFNRLLCLILAGLPSYGSGGLGAGVKVNLT